MLFSLLFVTLGNDDSDDSSGMAFTAEVHKNKPNYGGSEFFRSTLVTVMREVRRGQLEVSSAGAVPSDDPVWLYSYPGQPTSGMFWMFWYH